MFRENLAIHSGQTAAATPLLLLKRISSSAEAESMAIDNCQKVTLAINQLHPLVKKGRWTMSLFVSTHIPNIQKKPPNVAFPKPVVMLQQQAEVGVKSE